MLIGLSRLYKPEAFSYARPAMGVLFSIAIFVLLGTGFVLFNLTLGSLFRPRLPHPAKAAPYECGEVSVGAGWVQFDLRFYTIALVFLVFDVEVALFYPWAVIYGNALRLATAFHATAFALRTAALTDLLLFFTPLLVGFGYLWRFGYLDWVRSTATTTLRPIPPAPAAPHLTEAALPIK